MNTDSITIIERQPVEYVENNRVYTLDELREMFGSVPGNVVVPLLDIITRLRTALAESEAMRGRQMKTIDEMRGTIRVLGEEVAEWQKVLDGVTQYDGDRYTLLREKIKARNADPAARAAVEGV